MIPDGAGCDSWWDFVPARLLSINARSGQLAKAAWQRLAQNVMAGKGCWQRLRVASRPNLAFIETPAMLGQAKAGEGPLRCHAQKKDFSFMTFQVFSWMKYFSWQCAILCYSVLFNATYKWQAFHHIALRAIVSCRTLHISQHAPLHIPQHMPVQ